ncbi:MAG: carboxypeptidase-like regulatory domain-containing protein, partial [Bacteroidota bacterium]
MSKITLLGFIVQSFCYGFMLAGDVKGQKESIEEIHVELRKSNIKLKSVFQQISAQTQFEFSYDHSVVNDKQLISLIENKGTLGSVLRALSKENSLSFKRVNNNIFVSKNYGNTASITEYVEPKKIEQQVISGVVTSIEDGEPLPGVSILIKGTSVGTTTNFEGEYSINVSSSATLQFSFIGYETQEIEVGNQTEIDIVMQVDLGQLDEVVVVGYGTQRKSDLTGAVGSISEEEVRAVPTLSLDQSLQGRVAGVQVTQANAQPGGTVSVRIRGGNSITAGNEPLYVVDGFIGAGDLNSINPNDIASIEILKDASATAIYGARGANGVVLITTKSGKSAADAGSIAM